MTYRDVLARLVGARRFGMKLGLERMRELLDRLGAPDQRIGRVIHVAGTNGKGSTVAFLEAMLRADGKRVGAYTSPHLLRYNERVRIDGAEARDDALVGAFERIEAARGDIALTYFEYGTLAAIVLFAEADLDVALLEVGLGGRLDAVNLIDADVAIVTTIDIDHQDWLGNDRDSIGREKAGIFRAGRPAIIGDGNAPRGLLEAAERIGADLRIAGRDFSLRSGNGWLWRSGDATVALPDPALEAPCQIDDAAAAIAAMHALRDRLGWNVDAIRSGVADARVGARLQRFASAPEVVVDVAHNPQAARVLARWLATHRARGRTIAVFGALDDKDVSGIVEPLRDAIDAWHLAGLAGDSPRGLAASALGDRVQGVEVAGAHDDVASALAAAFDAASSEDRIIAFGSFFVAAAALTFAGARGLEPR